MSRLKHSPKGFIKSLQLSRADLFAFVEGWSDRYFYDKVCRTSCDGTGLNFEVRTAEELPGGTGGKTALLAFFSHLRRRRLLLHEFKGKKLAILFFLDKDVDDLVGRRKRSKFIIYTRYYQLENYLMRHTDLCEVGAATACLDVGAVRLVMGDQQPWMLRAATEWKEWVKLCLTARVLNAKCSSTYASYSQVNAGPYGGIVQVNLDTFKASLNKASGLPAKKFEQVLGKVSRRVERIFAAGWHDSVFKGKWYTNFLTDDLHQAAAGRPYDVNSLGRLLAVANAKVDLGQPWAQFFKNRVTVIIQALQDYSS